MWDWDEDCKLEKKLKVAKNPKIKYRILFWKEIRKLKLNLVLNSTACFLISQVIGSEG